MSFFGELYLRSTRPFLAEETSAREAAFIAQTLRLERSRRALDIGCGHGRHLQRLVARGLDVWGVDNDALSLAQLGPEARARAVRGDLYHLPFRASFDAAYAWYATLFISDDDRQNQAALAEATRALRPGGELLVHGHNPVAEARDGESLFKATLDDGAALVEETWYDSTRNVLHGHRRLTHGARVLEGRFLVRCPTLEDHARWAKALGLRLEATYGDAAGRPYRRESPDLIVFLRR